MKKNVIFSLLVPLFVGQNVLPADYTPPRTQTFDFPIYTNKPPGKQITAGQLPATTPALAPEKTRQLIQVPPGFEVRLFAAEPMVANPVAMTWDERGRLWVLELYEYPKGAAKGAKGRDRIKILEDTDADGHADKVTVFADGFSLAEGMILGNGGLYVGAPPNLYFLKDTNSDDKADTREVVLAGFGDEDRHELLNGFAWGPDGWLYMTHGVFTHSKVKDPDNPNDDGVRMDAALARFHPATRKFEVFADGTSNPWGVDWNERGDAFVSACVIQHLFHMAPGGQYNRQGGTWANPYGYVQDLPSKGLPAIVDWRHHRAAHAGITIYQGDQWPAEWRGLVFIGNIHQSALNCDRLTPVGATYKAVKETTLLGLAGAALLQKSGEKVPRGEEWKFVGPGNFLVSRDPWFRPVSNQTGPDGALWVMDWYDKYPCYQNAQADPEGVDREYGRIWRVVWVGDQPGKPVPSRPSKEMDLKKLSGNELVHLALTQSNSWQHRQALRLLGERRDSSAAEVMAKAVSTATLSRDEAWLTVLQAFHTSGAIKPEPTGEQSHILYRLANMDSSLVQTATARIIGDLRDDTSHGLAALLTLSTNADARVRAAVATALRQFASGSLTVDTPAPTASIKAGLPASVRSAFVLPHLERLLARPSVEGDFYYPHIVWMAMEPRVAANPEPFFRLLEANENSASAYCTRRLMRRICDLSDATTRATQLNQALNWLGGLAPKTDLAGAALDGLIEAQKSKGAPPTIELAPILAKLMANPALAEKARRLATLLGDKGASQSLIARINDPKANLDERLKGIQAARETKDEASRTEVLKLMTSDKAEPLLLEGARSLSAFSGDEIAYALTDAWKNYSLPVRRAVADVLVTRSKWARALLAGVEAKVVDPQDISATARRALARADDKTVNDNADRLLGRYRAPGADKLKLIADKRKVVLNGTPDVNNGHEVAKRTCFVCHKLYGEGADIAPDLTGVGRSTLDALLHNVIDPNEVIGNGFETTEVTLKDDSTVSGRVVEETETRLKLAASGPTEHTIAKSDIKIEDGKPAIRKTELSLMPEGLEQIPDKDFRDLILYILNPPGDNRPWTPSLRKELIGDENAAKKEANAPAASLRAEAAPVRAGEVPPVDGESVALWNPDWRVLCPPFEGAPNKLPEYAGRRNVLRTHPVDRKTPSAIERAMEIPAGRKSTLGFQVASDEQGDWELRVLVDSHLLHNQIVDKKGERWKTVNVDLTPYAGKRITLRLENAANDWNFEFGYWSRLEIESSALSAKVR